MASCSNFSPLQLSDNGYITFKVPVLSNSPKPFPVSTGSNSVKSARMIAPYWSDVDTRCGGDIYYREVQLESSSDPIVKYIQEEVALTGVGANFSPKHAFIVTWEKVKAQTGNPCHDTRVRAITRQGSIWGGGGGLSPHPKNIC